MDLPSVQALLGTSTRCLTRLFHKSIGVSNLAVDHRKTMSRNGHPRCKSGVCLLAMAKACGPASGRSSTRTTAMSTKIRSSSLPNTTSSSKLTVASFLLPGTLVDQLTNQSLQPRSVLGQRLLRLFSLGPLQGYCDHNVRLIPPIHYTWNNAFPPGQVQPTSISRSTRVLFGSARLASLMLKLRTNGIV